MTHFRLDVTITSITSITSGFCTDVTLDVHFQGAALLVCIMQSPMQGPRRALRPRRPRYSKLPQVDRQSPSKPINAA